ncbi:MAG: hypothetical protein KDC92_07180, partial [Bacteroidetes bacterium]|nr:hypothetical protein [Bacteroidota bacterium]
MRKAHMVIALMALVFSDNITAQTVSPCSTDEMQNEYYKSNPELKQKEETQFISGLNAYRTQARKKASNDCNVRFVPTVVHVIYNGTLGNISDAKVQEMLDQCNAALLQKNYTLNQVDEIWHDRAANLQVELKLAKKDAQGNPTSGIIRTESDLTTGAGENVKSISRAWDQKRYLNIWVVASIRTIGNGTTLGYAFLPSNNLAPGDGIIVRSDLPDRFPTTLSHEVGHYLGLRHPFENGCDESTTKGCDETGDFVCDTPPRSESRQDCPMNLNSCTNDSPDERDMVENIMDYTSCRVMFTAGQKEIVDFVFKEYRPKLIEKANWFSTGIVDSTTKFGEIVADFSADISAICQDGQVTFRDQSCTDIKNTIYTWQFENGTPSISFDRNPKVTYKAGGFHNVTLIIKNGTKADTLTRENFINVIANTATITAPYYESFEGGTNFPLEGWTKTDGSSNLYWSVTNEAASDGNNSLVLKNFNVNSNGDEFTIELPSINFSTQRATTFNFDVAYARESIESDKEDLRV